MKKRYSCKNTKNEEAAAKMRKQWKELRKLFEEMVKLSDSVMKSWKILDFQ